MSEEINFHYPLDIRLKSSPLVEAWLTIQWELQPRPNNMGAKDPAYSLAVEEFSEEVRDRFENKVLTDIDDFPEELAPYRPRVQFRQGSDEGWPLLQLGPGVATVNHVTDYTWDKFKADALYLHTTLLKSYKRDMAPRLISLRYRNAVPFDHEDDSLEEFLENALNLRIELPEFILGNMVIDDVSREINHKWVIHLKEPEGIGTLIVATGTKQSSETEEPEKSIIFEIEIQSTGDSIVSILDKDQNSYSDWLEDAHRVAHEWFFSLIDGQLREYYETSGEGNGSPNTGCSS